MTEWDMAPTDHPDPAQLRDAIQKGLGRAVIWAKSGVWNEKDILLEACLQDLRYDKQCEETRGPWLWKIMEAVGVIEDFREKILSAVRVIDDGLGGEQLCELCIFYARQGDERFRIQLQDIVARKPIADCPWLGEQELLTLDGEAGFLFAVRARGASLLNRDWDWDDTSMIDLAIEKLGEHAAVTVLDRESQSSTAIGRFRDAWRAAVRKEASDPREKHADRMRQFSVNDVIQMAEDSQHKAGMLRGWGMFATETDLEVILDRLLQCQDPGILGNYLRVFSNRPMPEFDQRILGLLDHEDESVRRRAFTAVGKNTHPAVRKYASGHLQTRIGEPNFLELFVRNFRSGDEESLLKHIRIPEDVNKCHWLLMDLFGILEHNLESRCQKLAQLVYRRTPCSACRSRSAKLLVNRNVAPAWLIDECQNDAVPDTRELAAASGQVEFIEVARDDSK